MMCMQLEPNIAREVSNCLDGRSGKGPLHQESYKEYHGSCSTDVEDSLSDY